MPCCTCCWSRVVRRERSWSTRARCSPTSGTTRLAASVGVEARTSATSSSSGRSFSWPMALTTGVVAAATARTRRSSLKPSSVCGSPPPRAMTMTSTGGVGIELLEGGRSPRRTLRSPWTAAWIVRKSTCGQRSWALRSTSFSASEFAPVMSPMRDGEERERLLARGLEQALLAGAAGAGVSSFSSWAPRPTWRIGRHLERERAALREVVGLEVDDDVVADVEVVGEAGEHARPHLDADLRVGLERSLMPPKTLRPRTFHWVISPSAQTAPQRSIDALIVWLRRAMDVGGVGGGIARRDLSARGG